MNREKEFYDLPEWVKFVNKLLHRRGKWEEEKERFKGGRRKQSRCDEIQAKLLTTFNFFLI